MSNSTVGPEGYPTAGSSLYATSNTQAALKVPGYETRMLTMLMNCYNF